MSLQSQGLRAWLWQRLTSVYIGVFVLVALFAYLLHGPWSYTEWRMLFAHPAINIATALLVLALLFHAWVGLRDILVDYVPALGLRFGILVILMAVLLALGIWAMWTLIRIVAL